jgi:uncharacterized protein YlxP (DUF503 family)
MVVGVVVWELLLPGCASLKDKRQVVKSLKDRLQGRFKLSAAEVGLHDTHGRARLAACVVSVERVHAQQVLQAADQLVESEGRARIVDATLTFY